MVQYIIILVCGLWCIYNNCTMYFNLPYINLVDGSNFVVDILSVAVLRWSLILGVFGLICGILGLIKLSKVDDFDTVKNALTVFYIIVSILLIL